MKLMVPSRGSPDVALGRETVLEELKAILDPATGEDIVSAGMVRALQVNGNSVRFVLEVPAGRADEMAAVAMLRRQPLLRWKAAVRRKSS